jgi:hypothetical protein
MRETWQSLLARSAVSGGIASLLSTALIAARSARATGSPFSGTNAVSHCVWGESAKLQRRFSVRHTVLGYAIHHASAVFWAALYERATPPALRAAKPLLNNAVVVTAVAGVTDYLLMPKRLQPGFESSLSLRSTLAAYAAIAAGLALGHRLWSGHASSASARARLGAAAAQGQPQLRRRLDFRRPYDADPMP